jgi:hypothetical protein
VIPVAMLMRHKTVWRIAGRSLLLLAAMAGLTGWRLTAAFAQAPGESLAVSIDDTDLTGIEAITEGQSSCDASDQTPQPEASGQTSPRGATGQPSTGSTPNASSTQKQPKKLSVNPVTGIVSASEANYEPLSGKERWKVYFKMNYASTGAYFGPVFTALVLDQATGSPAQWGGGFAGFGRRVASRVGSAIVQGTVQAPVAALLHEDVRYISSSQRGIKRRAWHAVKYSFLTYNEQGRPTLNVANLGSYYAAAAISTTWLPSHDNLATYTLSNATEQVGLSIPINLLQEFWPEIRRGVFRRQ